MGWKLFRVLRWSTDSTKPALNKLGALLMPGDTKRLWLSLASGWFAADTPPVGATYMRFPGLSDPETLWPNTDWENISSSTLLAGRVPRIEGAAPNGSAASFGSTQDDQLQIHTHTVACLVANRTHYAGGDPGSSGEWLGTNTTPTSANNSGRNGNETRVASVTVQVWQRIS